jgi:hypothetical protein
MNYFNELLESYSRLKKRSLRLLEKESPQVQVTANPESLAQQAISQAKNATKENPYIAQTPRGNQIAVFTTQDGQVDFTTSVQNGQAGGFIKSVNNNYEEFLSYFGSDSAAAQPGESEVEGEKPKTIRTKAEPGDTADKNFPGLGLGKVIKKFASHLTDNFLKKLQKYAPDKSKYGPGATVEKFRTYFLGAKPQSIENAIDNASVIRLNKDNNQVEFSQGDGMSREDKKTLKIAATKLEIMTGIAAKVARGENLTGEDISFLKTSIKLVGSCRAFMSNSKNFGDCRVMLAVNGEGSDIAGVVFSDNKGQIKTMLRMLQEGSEGYDPTDPESKFTPEKVKLYEDPNGKAIQTNYAHIMEIASVLRHHYSNCNKSKGDAKYQAYCAERAKKLVEKYGEKMESITDMVIALQRQREKGETAGIYNPEIEQMVELFNIGGNKDALQTVFKHIRSVTDQARANRNPLTIINRGAEVGSSKRTDNVEVYKTEQELKQALLNSGISEKEYQDMIDDGTIKINIPPKDAFGENQEEYDIAKKHGIVSDSQPVCVFNISEKYYRKLDDGVKIGSRRSSTIKNTLKGINEKPNDPRSKADLELARNSLKRNLNLSNRDLEDAADYDDQLDDEIDGTLNKFFVGKETIVDGKKTKVWDGPKTANAVLEHIRKNCTQDQLNKHPHYSQIVQAANALASGSEKNPERLLSLVSTFAKMKKCQSDSESSDPNVAMRARKYLASKMFLTGGASDGAYVNANATTTNERITFRQNKIFSDAVQSAVRGDGEWEFRFDENGNVGVYNKNDSLMNITMGFQADQSAEGFSTTHSVYSSKEIMLRYADKELATASQPQSQPETKKKRVVKKKSAKPSGPKKPLRNVYRSKAKKEEAEKRREAKSKDA